MGVTMCFGVFDNFHPGHASYLQQANKFNQDLVIVVARDLIVEEEKKHQTQIKEKERVRIVNDKLKEMNIKGEAVLGNLNDKWEIVKKYQPSVIFLGYDQEINEEELLSKLNELNIKCEIKRGQAYYPEKYKSSFCVVYE